MNVSINVYQKTMQKVILLYSEAFDLKPLQKHIHKF